MPLVIAFARLLFAWALVAVGLAIISRLSEPRGALARTGGPDRLGESAATTAGAGVAAR
jgi:hypothetical protein